jgi:hypothetical protein
MTFPLNSNPRGLILDVELKFLILNAELLSLVRTKAMGKIFTARQDRGSIVEATSDLYGAR